MNKGPSFLLLSEVLHLLSAGVWLGSLIPLLLVIHESSPEAAASVARRFSPLGLICVVGLSISAMFQGSVLIGSLPGIVGTAYGWVTSIKLAFLLILLGLAAANRYRYTPLLLAADPLDGRRSILRTIGIETGVGFLAVIAAGVLSSLAPAMHVQPVWPFTVQLSLRAVQEEPAFKQEVIEALGILLIAGVMFIASVSGRRVRWPAMIVSGAIAGLALPHLDLLFAEAVPTSFYHSPTGFAATSITEGATLFPANCASCHGEMGRGDGPSAKSSPVPPADLTAAHLFAHSDGEMFWWLVHGIEASDGKQVMPGFEATLSDDQRWSLIDFVRAHNIGLVHAATGAWVPSIHAPGFQASCPDGTNISIDEMQGKIVRLIFVVGADYPVLSIPARKDTPLLTILAPAKPGLQLSQERYCIAQDLKIAEAYAIVTGIPTDALGGESVLDRPKRLATRHMAAGYLRRYKPRSKLGRSGCLPKRTRLDRCQSHYR